MVLYCMTTTMNGLRHTETKGVDDMEHIWIYKVNNGALNGIVSADSERDATERVFDKYFNYGIRLYDIVLIKAEEYKNYDGDHNVLELELK